MAHHKAGVFVIRRHLVQGQGVAVLQVGPIRFIQRLVPEEYWERVFFDNANRIYGLGL